MNDRVERAFHLQKLTSTLRRQHHQHRGARGDHDLRIEHRSLTESRARLLDCQSRFAMDRPARMVHEQLRRAVMEVELQRDWPGLEPREAAKRMMTQLSSRPEFKEAIAMRTESVPPDFLQSAHISDGEAAVEDNLVGCEVTLRGLKSDPGKNGRIGKVKAWLPDRGRFAVVLLDDDGFETRAGGGSGPEARQRRESGEGMERLG